MEENTEKKEKKQIKISLGTAICIFIIIFLVAAIVGTVLYYNSKIVKENNTELKPIEENIEEVQGDTEENKETVETEKDEEIKVSTEAGNFVEYNGELYFWKLSADNKEEISLFGAFYCVPGSENNLVKLDKEGNEEIIYTGEGAGKILIVNDKIYSSYGENEYDEVKMIYCIGMNGENKVEFRSGTIETNIGNYIICQTKLDGDIFRINTITNEVEVLKENANFIKCIDGKVYYYEPYDSEEKILKIGTITDNNDNGIVATISNDEFKDEYGGAEGRALEVLNIVKEDDEIKINVGYRSGSAGYIQRIKAIIINENGKARKEDVSYKAGEFEDLDDVREETIKLRNDETVIYIQHLEEASLEYINKATNQVVQIMSKDEINKKFGFADDSEHIINFYDYAIIDKDIYIVLDYGEHYPEEDIGWRYAYKRLKTVCFKYNIDTDEITELYSF